MTMEDRSGGMERAAPATVNNVTSSSPSDASYPFPRSVKRSFDVAFLVAPDENLARRQSEKLRLVSTEKLTEKRSHVVREVNVTTDHEADRMPQNLTIKHFDQERKILQTQISPPYISPRLHVVSPPKASPEATETMRRYSLSQLQKTPSPPIFLNQPLNKSLESGEVTAKGYDAIPSPDKSELRSAFTKVAFAGQKNGYDSSQVSPRSSVSPDQLSYQSSISPPVNLTNQPAYKYAPFPGKVAYPFLMNHETQQNSILDNLKMPQISQPPKDFSNQLPSPKVAGFRPEMSPVYPNLPYNPISVFPPMAEALARPRFLATAAGVTGLLPPSFAALTLPAQNVCAKCNLSFRMTSDLVYHMRSHHKSENAGEAARRRREEKLRCPVCDESFRERHHLTRHMTAHQDKESDAIVDQVEIKRRSTAVHGKWHRKVRDDPNILGYGYGN